MSKQPLSPQETAKKHAAEAAIPFIEKGSIVGVGTGSTVNYFIDALAAIKFDLEGAVSSSDESTRRLKALGIPVYDLNGVPEISVYVDGADEINRHLQMIKGGGGALTREKIVAAVAKRFICIADKSKFTKKLGDFPLPIEVIPMARSYVARELVKLGGDPVYREGFVTDNGNIILDVHHLDILKPIAFEETLNNITGVVTNGLFAARPADIALLSDGSSIETLKR